MSSNWCGATYLTKILKLIVSYFFQQDQITHWLDLSQIYGSSRSERNAIKTGSGQTNSDDEDENTGGKIKLLPKGQGSGVVGTFRKACVEEGCHLTG